jgi:aspartate ammonia-lyase
MAKEAYETEGKTVRQVALAKQILDEARLNELLDPRAMTEPK